MSVSPEEIAYQQAHASDFNADGLSAFCITGVVVVFVAVMLRMWSRRIQRIPLQADDFTLIVAMFLSLTAVMLFDVRVYHWGMGRHFYAISEHDRVKFEKIDYAFNLFYTTGYPLSRVSLVLLYRRIFVQSWFHKICYFFVFVFTGYMISTIVVDSLLDIPVNAYWNANVTPEKTVNLVKLYIANAAFNIATDTVLIILPLTIIWRLSMTNWQKVGLTAIFCMGGLTLVASIARLVFFFQVNRADISYTLIPIVWWTSAELFLGVLCPCLVTFRPLLRAAASFVTTRVGKSYYSHTGDTGVERLSDKTYKMKSTNKSGSDDASLLDYPESTAIDAGARKEYKISNPFQLKQPAPAMTSDMVAGGASVSRNRELVNAEEEACVATLDPRTSRKGVPLGTTTEAEALPPSPPQPATSPGYGSPTSPTSTHVKPMSDLSAFNFSTDKREPSAMSPLEEEPRSTAYTIRHRHEGGDDLVAMRNAYSGRGLDFGGNGKGVSKGMIGVKKSTNWKSVEHDPAEMYIC